MKRSFIVACFLSRLAVISCTALFAQEPIQQLPDLTCAGPVYVARDVSVKAKLLSKIEVFPTEEARANNVHGRVVAEAVLCRTGQVTDVRIIQGLGHGMDETVISGLKRLRFTPAEKDWHTVSQLLRFEWHYNDETLGHSAAEAAKRLVEAVTVIGNRRLKADEILSWVKTKPGDVFNAEQVQRDLLAIVEKGLFDSHSARVGFEAGIRGGIIVRFELQELPIINELSFEGLTEIPEANVIDALEREKIFLKEGNAYDPVKVREAIRVIKRILSIYSFQNSEVDVRTEQSDSTSVRLIIVIKTDFRILPAQE
jgi:TonB family protein